MSNTGSRKWREDDPRRIRMGEKRAEILNAARPILLRDGLGGTSLDRVAAEGKISKMTLYRHFSSKEALFEGLVMSMCEYIRIGLENAPLADINLPAEKRLREELHAFAFALIQPDALALYRVIVSDGWRIPNLSSVFEQTGMRLIRKRISDLLEFGGVAADRRGQIAGEVVALTLGDAYQRAILGIAQENDREVFEQQIEVAIAHAFQGLGSV
ncbi:TetR family transcriptional regulator [Duganella sp. FT135W]|uniref:TetR family transcriptional regulator n=1 Tax=Duganella flavida TaxID=2692175 RepID=A0A6L8KJ82_9BURK|nr:TetR/AcrR family transcriptional regulator [Duganella flavida]MYM26268.1 TetR family transcriptional regulator [Duganella flavida]